MTNQLFELNKHHCELAVLKCIDFRFREADQRFISQQFGVSDFDLIAWPGAAKSIVHDQAMRDNLAATIQNVCCDLHGVKRLVLLNHWDCGGYGGSRAFASAAAEAEIYRNDLRQARELLQPNLPQVEIILAFSQMSDSGLDYQIL